MPNELIFFIKLILVISFTLFAFRMGKHWLMALVPVYIVLANIFVTKQILLFGLAATGGNVVYGCTFLATDLLSEHFSRKDARQAVYLGFFAALVFVVLSQLIIAFTPSEEDFVHGGMATLFSLTPRIVAGSMAAYLISQFHDIWAYHFWRKKTSGRHLWLRNNFSTWASQLIDSSVFVVAAFWGIFPGRVLLQIIITTYLLKICVALIDTPFIYLSYVIKPKGKSQPVAG